MSYQEKKTWQEIITLIEQSDRILISTHVNPDGDALGAEAALYYCLVRMGKSPFILNSSNLPTEYDFLNRDHIFNTYRPERHNSILQEYDLLFVLDISDAERLGRIGIELRQLNLPTICLDHHPNHKTVFSLSVVDTRVAATVVLIYRLILKINKTFLDKRIAEAIYVGLMTDTGSFRFENTDRVAFRLAADLLKYAIQPGVIFSSVYENYRPQRMRLLGMILQEINYEYNGQLAWFTVTAQQIKDADAIIDEVDGFTDFVRSIKGVEIAMMFLEVGPQRTRMNFRSKGRFPVNDITRSLGGGGHPFAAGLALDVPLTTALERVLPRVREVFNQQKK